MPRLLYSLLYTLLLPVLLLRLWWRGRKAPGYRQRIGERLGFSALNFSQAPIWVHSVSVGETIAAAPMIKALQERYPDATFIPETEFPMGTQQIDTDEAVDMVVARGADAVIVGNAS